VRTREGTRQRVQIVQGVVIDLHLNGGDSNFTVRTNAQHDNERTFLLKSPRVEKIEVVRRARVRRAQLYYVRGRRGRAARLKAKTRLETARRKR
jgi:large subunit ribosomal protein L19